MINSDVLYAYGIDKNAEISLFHGGHINDTYLVKSDTGNLMIQRINHFVFKSPEHIMSNMTGVTDFLKRKIKLQGGDVSRETLSIIPTNSGSSFYLDNCGNYWRCMPFIENSIAYETPKSPQMLYEAGWALGKFQNMLSDYPAENLYEIIPDFHNTPVRYSQLMDASNRNEAKRLSLVSDEIAFAKRRETDGAFLINLLNRGELPLRVTHNDTKMSNVLFDSTTHKALCMIDMDTVMPGLVAFDFGDSIRSAATTAAEDEADLSKVSFDLELFSQYTCGYIDTAGASLTEKEIETLPNGAIIITLEIGMRFLADYLNGDVYFKTKYPEHNLDRARNQFKLVTDMENHLSDMQSIVKQHYKTIK